MAKFKKGQTGNAKGRPPGAPNKATRAFREAVAVVCSELGGDHMLTWARDNPGAFYTIASRLVPPGTPVNIGPLEGTLAEKSDKVIAAMASGVITPEQASTIMSALTAQARIVEIDDLARRVKTLEESQPNANH